MSYAVIKSAHLVREAMEPHPPALSLICLVLKRWRAGRNTADISRLLRIHEAEVCRILATDQDCRHAVKAVA